MRPRVLPIHESTPQARHVQEASRALEKGELVLSPTETGYCFVGDAALPQTHTRFLRMRAAHPRHKPFSVLCSSITQMSEIALLETPVFRVATRVLPGPYTFVLPANRQSDRYMGEIRRKTLGVRISSHPVTAALCASFEKPLLVTSVTDAEELITQGYYLHEDDQESAWWTSVDAILRHHPHVLAVALEIESPVPLHVSTVVDFTQTPPILLRDGGWPLDALGVAAG